MSRIQHSNLSLTQFKAWALSLGKDFRRQNLVIGLVGNLGSGKTTFVKSFAQAFGTKKITSPTFTIMGTYQLANHDLYHLDFYRLKKINELEEVGLHELLAQNHRTMLIEWVDKFPKIMKMCDVIIKFKIGKNNKRDAEIRYRK